MIITDHAIKEMEQSSITEGEVKNCILNGKRIIKQLVKNEMRYGNQLELKDKKIIVIYTYNNNNEERIITTYPVRRKKQW